MPSTKSEMRNSRALIRDEFDLRRAPPSFMAAIVLATAQRERVEVDSN